MSNRLDKKAEGFATLQDEWGGVDKEILDAVILLNKLGIITVGSCYGHNDKSSPAPWISVGANPEYDEKLSAESWIAQEKARKLLEEFYANRVVPDSVKIIVDDVGGKDGGFWIHNGGEEWKEWKACVDEVVAKIKRGERATGYFTDERKAKRAKTLPMYQKEMDGFTAFLRTKLEV